jgi:hypothetical protein
MAITNESGVLRHADLLGRRGGVVSKEHGELSDLTDRPDRPVMLAWLQLVWILSASKASAGMPKG